MSEPRIDSESKVARVPKAEGDPSIDEVLCAFRTLRRHLPATLRQAEAELEAAWFNRGPLPVDWPARFRAAADAAELASYDRTGQLLRDLATRSEHAPSQVVEAIGRALLGGTS